MAGASLEQIGALADEEKEGPDESALPSPPLFAPSAPTRGLVPLFDHGAPPQLPPFIKARDAWGAGPPAQPYVAHVPRGVSLHHSGSAWAGEPPVEQYLRNIQAFHVGPRREWEDIAYHFLIDLQGGIWAGRPATVRGNPSIYYDPSGLVLICFLGDYAAQVPADPQLAAAAKTTAWVIRRFELRPDAITGHRDHAPTTCPGEQLYRLVQDGSFARRVKEQLTTTKE